MGQTNDLSSVQNTVVFKISHPNLEHTSYIFGSHHAFGKAFFDTLEHVQSYIDKSTLLIKENVEIEGQSVSEIINERNEVTNWKNLLNKNNYYFIDSLFSKSPIDYNKLTPPELYAFLSRYYNSTICQDKLSSDSSLSLDNYIEQVARNKGIPAIGLETNKEQIDLINKDLEGMPVKKHRKRLDFIINKIRTQDQSACSEVNWYKNMLIDYQLNTACSNSLMLTNRNAKWMSQLEVYLAENDCFIVVGLSHLMYDCGLISALIEKGFTIEPVDL